MTRRLVLLLLLSAPSALAAQTPPVLTRLEPGTCPRCTLKLEYVATVGAATDEELLNDRATLLPLRGGGFLAWGEGLMPLYDARGKFLRTVGKLGEGPGEYRTVNGAANAKGDSVLLYAYGRMITISIATGRGRTARSLRPISAFRVVPLPDGNVLTQNYAGAPGPFVVLAPDGSVRAGFGPILDSVRRRTGRMDVDFDGQQYAVAASNAGGFWASRLNYAPQLQRWSVDGRVLQTISYKPKWFTPYDYPTKQETDRPGIGGARPLPRVLGIWVDGKEQIFSLGRIPDRAWKPAPEAASAPRGNSEGSRVPGEPTGGMGKYIDMVFDVYDGKSGEHLGSWRSDEWPGMPIGDGVVAERRQSDDGVYFFRIWRVVLGGR